MPVRNPTTISSMLLLVTLTFACGCAPTSSNQSSDANLSSAPPDSIVTLTEEGARMLRQQKTVSQQTKYVFISVDVVQNCKGFLYKMEFRDSVFDNDVILTSSRGLQMAIDRDDAPFLTGTTLDYLKIPGGFKFQNPREDTSLLKEYRELRELEAKSTPTEESQAN